MNRVALLCALATLTACVPSAPPATSLSPAPLSLSADEIAGAAPMVEQQGMFASEAVHRAAILDAAVGDQEAMVTTGPAPSWDIAVAPYASHERVEHYVARYTGPARSWVTERLARGTRYEPMIREKLRAAGLPEDMYYLAFVESGFDPHAYSRAAAVGMWQFMTSTAKGMNLQVDWWVDERRDPVRATDAAVRFLSSLHRQFGSLYLAAAAYNGGPTRVARGLSRFAGELETVEGEDRFFTLAEQAFLPKETKEYVPQIIAAALVGNDAERYGIAVEKREPFAYDSVMVPALTSLPAIARAAGTHVATIRDLNPQFIRGITAPRVESQVRIPVGSRARFDSAFALLPPPEREGVRRERVATAVSLTSLAKKFGTTPRGITGFNPNLRRTAGGNIAAGQTLFIAPPDVANAAVDIPDPAIERYGSAGTANRHVVKSGETLSHISRQYDTSVAALMRLNKLTKPLIRVGQQIVVR